ncbi:MAG: hypothetical protein JNM56_15135 [Planctomycetia bacterium]|nr:hypothetical protein [Planctomycetia bacterium]
MSGRLLRPELYDRLDRVFGHVRIAHEGVEMVSRPYLSADLEVRLDITTRGETYCVSCPFCGDTRQRLWINHRWGYWDLRTQTRNLWLAHCFNEECLRSYDRQQALYREVFADVGDGIRDVILPGAPPPAEPVEVIWPTQLIPLDQLPEDHDACRYLRSRGFDPVLLSKHLGLNYCPWTDPFVMSMAKDRIIIPITMNGEPRGWTGRFIGEPPNKFVPKYYHMRDLPRGELLYNFDQARRSPYVVVCEGPSDVWRVGPCSVALLGKHASLAQRALLAKHWGQGAVVILLDNDAIDEAQELYDQLRDTVPRRVLVHLPGGKDPGDLTREQLDQIIQGAARNQCVDLLSLVAAHGHGDAQKTEATNSPSFVENKLER